MDYLDKYDELKKIICEEVELDGKLYKLEDEFDKFFIKGNSSAGTRVRKIMQIIRKLSENVRKDVQTYKNSL